MKRVLALISKSAQLIAESLAAKSQAESASSAASALLESSSKDDKVKKVAEQNSEDLKDCLKLKDDTISSIQKELEAANADKEAMKKQSESVSREYDNLLKEHAKLSAKLDKIENNTTNKKDD